MSFKKDNAYKAIYSSVATVWGTGLLAGNTPNPELKWESTYSSNLGLDINLFQNRIELIADIYYKKTNDLLLQVPLPAYVGTSGQGSTSAPWKNVGSLENKGLELALNGKIFTGKFKWDLGGNISFVKNKLLSLIEGNDMYIVPSSGSNLLGGSIHALINLVC